mmetsp:Transcript_93152/g.249471  ORF Transcript_93152/g.249471 Transcript_93152/m.249471 type:complete len:182 (-) Transcript_93152:189-734(-)
MEGGHSIPKMDHLVCFLAGSLALGSVHGAGDLDLAKRLGQTCIEIYDAPTGLAPEIVHFHEHSDPKDIYIKTPDAHNLLRPETVESLFYLWRITGEERWREAGWKMFLAWEKHSKVSTGGYSSVQSVLHIPVSWRDKMESFFPAETLKYLFLLFDDTWTEKLSLDQWVFNTEAHPLPVWKS